MGAQAFFVMLRASRKIRSYDMMELCDIAAIPMCDGKYYQKLRGVYQRQLQWEEPQTPMPDKLTSSPKPDVMKADSLDARYAMARLFTKAKGGPT